MFAPPVKVLTFMKKTLPTADVAEADCQAVLVNTAVPLAKLREKECGGVSLKNGSQTLKTH